MLSRLPSDTRSLACAVAIVLLLGAFRETRKYAVGVATVIIILWFLKWQRTKG
jgi:hypothetical protein